MKIKFQWDPKKEVENINKHKISFVDAIEVFNDPKNGTIFDVDHSTNEDRWITIGSMNVPKILVVVHTIRGENSDIYRIISARKATKNERKSYDRRLESLWKKNMILVMLKLENFM